MIESEMHHKVWKKYLPLIMLKLKQSIRKNESTFIGMYRFEFFHSSKKSKSGYQFDLYIDKGKTKGQYSLSEIAKSLSTVLTEDDEVSDLLESGNFIFSLNQDFVLSIHRREEALVN